MSKIKYFPEDMDVQNKTVILRLDLNVPLNKKKSEDSYHKPSRKAKRRKE